MRSGSRSTRISRATPPTRADAADAGHGRQLARDREVDEPRELRVRHVVRRDAPRDDGAAGRRDARDDRLVGVGRQIRADTRHRVADVVERGREIRAEAELDARRRRAFVDGRGHLLDAGDRRDGVLDLARDLAFHLRRRDAGIRDGDDDGRELDVGPIEHAELREAQEARDRQRDEENDDGNGIADRPGDEVHEPFTALLDADEVAVLQEAGALVDDALAGFEAARRPRSSRREWRPSRCGGARRCCPRSSTNT